ncbi:MAG: hypothetical protein KFF49_06685, partial [Bacteroidales bacterium]|nr:hypothetical protein [Bacteroidales bacterium]
MDQTLLISERIPITVGVVGHLDVITTDEHRMQIEKLFKDLAARFPNSPIHLFSSIAEGADRYVANIFLDIKRGNEEYQDRFELIVPIPFKAEEYKEDFDDASDIEFDELLKQAKRSFTVGDERSGKDRPDQYLETGKLVADSSLILIAMWDGKIGKKGGTADIVNYKLTGDDDTVAESTFEYDGTIFILPSARAKSAETTLQSTPGKESLSLDLVLKESTLKEALEKIEEINRASLHVKSSDLDGSQSYMFIKQEKLNVPQQSLLCWYSILDQLSLRSRKSDVVISVLMFVLGLSFIMTLEIYSNIWLNNIALLLTVSTLVIAAVLYLYSRLKQNHAKYLYSRTLAEALRIQFYWNIAGLQKNVSDYILRIHRKEFTWVKHVLSAIYGLSYNIKSIDPETINDLTDNWIKDQSGFFGSAIIKMNLRINRYRGMSNTSFFLALILLVSIFFFRDFYETNNYMNLLLVLAPILMGTFALIRAYIQMTGYKQLLNQYEL